MTKQQKTVQQAAKLLELPEDQVDFFQLANGKKVETCLVSMWDAGFAEGRKHNKYKPHPAVRFLGWMIFLLAYVTILPCLILGLLIGVCWLFGGEVPIDTRIGVGVASGIISLGALGTYWGHTNDW